MTRPDAGRVLARALLAWGLGHLALGRTGAGRAWLAAEIVAIAIVAWLTAGLVDTSAHLVPYVAGIGFLVAWTWQAVDAYRLARRSDPLPTDPEAPTPAKSPAVAIGWLSLPLLVWASGFWLFAAGAASPSATLDRFVTAWESDALDPETWGRGVARTAERVADRLGEVTDDRFRDVRVRIVEVDAERAVAVAEAVHYERRPSRFLGLFEGSELVPVADEAILRIDLAADDAGLPGGGSIGAVRWSITSVDATP